MTKIKEKCQKNKSDALCSGGNFDEEYSTPKNDIATLGDECESLQEQNIAKDAGIALSRWIVIGVWVIGDLLQSELHWLI